MTAKTSFTSTSIRWPTDLKTELERRARGETRTFSSYVIQHMREHLAGVREREAAERKARKA